ncbi:glycerate kinase [Fodinibacter luteus]|uniref:glycerate kinase n=1 Tax=Fodinibacter luteus TaxID=552064 RepID=UPI0031F196FD
MTRVGAPSVVVASDAFKGSLSSLDVADAVRSGVLDVVPQARVVVLPVADGGEGTVAAALACGWSPVPVDVHGPTGEAVVATVALRPAPRGPSPAINTADHELSTVDSTADRRHSSVDSTADHRRSTVDHSADQELSSVANTADTRRRTAINTADQRRSSVDTAGATPFGAGEAAHRPAVVHVTALVELADACGLGRLPGGVPAPLTASSRGLGEAIRGALDLGATEVVVGVGGSASTDGGAGALAALGARLLDESGSPLADGGAALSRLAHLDVTGLDRRLEGTRLVLAADVDSPLLGPAGAAVVFGPQKGARPEDVTVLEAALTRWADVVAATPLRAFPRRSAGGPARAPGPTGAAALAGMPGAGAAGGVGFALLTVLGAERRSGVDVVLDLVGLEGAFDGADLVVTGEGSLDPQTLMGKAVAGVTRRATAHGIPAVAVCGLLALDEAGLTALGVRAAYPLSDLEADPARSVRDARVLLHRTGARIAREWLSRPPA